MSRLRWLSALLLTAIGLYFSRALLDIVSGSGGVIRVAMLPPWWELAAFVIVAIALAVVAARADRDADVILPVCALGLLALPYLPWLPDRVPVLRGLGGPARDVLWIAVSWLVGSRALAGLPWNRLAAHAPLAIFVASAAIFGAVAWRTTTTVQYPSGDEPHYLVITQSLLLDHDFRIENNHRRGDYRAYFPLQLRPDYLTRGSDREIYSIHPVGLPILSMPAFALGGYRGVVAMIVVMAGLAAALIWTWARDTSGSASAATFGWAATALTTPFLFNSFTIYPEIPGALAVSVALAWRRDSTTTGTLVSRGIAIGVLPWLSTKYAVMAAAIAFVLAMRVRWKMRALTVMAVPAAILFALWFAFFYWIWGTFSPSAPYGASEPMTIRNLAHGAPGLLFDQEYGIVAYAPVLMLAFVGLVRLLSGGTDSARRAIEVSLVLGALLVTVGGFHIWWGGSAAPGRPVASGVLLLAIPIGSAFAATSRRPAARGTCQALLAVSVALAVVVVTREQGTLIQNGRDGTSTMLGWMSPTWPLTTVFPSYINVDQTYAEALLRTFDWLALTGLVAWGTSRVARGRAGAASLAALVFGVAGGAALATATRSSTAPATIDPTARARVPLLDEFDARRRPIVLAYDPLRRMPASEALSRASFVVRPDQRQGPEPVKLLWNARFTLPAGEYRLKLERPPQVSAQDGAIGLQIGRVGQPLDRWQVRGPEWTQTVTLPLDTSLVGPRAMTNGGLEDGTFSVVPLRVVDESLRTRRPPILSATRYGPLAAYFHDDTINGEPTGFWTHGRATTRVSVAALAGTPTTVDADVRCGPIANQVTLRMPGWTEQFAIEPGGSHHVSIPLLSQASLSSRLAPLDVIVRDGFVPADVDPASTDRRVLGCWIEMPSTHRSS
jgi:hypothetical protein